MVVKISKSPFEINKSSFADLDRRANPILGPVGAVGARLDAGYPTPEAVRADLGEGLHLGLREPPRPARQRHPPARREATLQQVWHLYRGETRKKFVSFYRAYRII